MFIATFSALCRNHRGKNNKQTQHRDALVMVNHRQIIKRVFNGIKAGVSVSHLGHEGAIMPSQNRHKSGRALCV